MEDGVPGGTSAGETQALLTYEEAMTLTLIVHRGLTYRQVAHRTGRTPRDTLLVIRTALERAGSLRRPA